MIAVRVEIVELRTVDHALVRRKPCSRGASPAEASTAEGEAFGHAEWKFTARVLGAAQTLSLTKKTVSLHW
jgi:hypothetical protein